MQYFDVWFRLRVQYLPSNAGSGEQGETANGTVAALQAKQWVDTCVPACLSCA